MINVLGAGLLAGYSAVTQAHHPVLACQAMPDDKVLCTGGFSDGSKAPGVTLDVIASAGNRILSAGRLDAHSQRVFRRPDENFYVLLEVGPGHTAVVDPAEIKPASKR
ncbi:hypothetical protein [Bordetella genomosp. 12]|uniref:Uncharacterized protein n=1 Tax=Bordetella genomosp. 12 TaxID=463035 RepID=A0A261VCP7_9BORD|nr:hypothetical protein CAL22_13620 [Bordetella genomosp. 12]